MSTTNKVTWNEENEARLQALAGQSPVSQETVLSIAEEMNTSARSIGAKLRKLGFEVDRVAAKPSAWSDEEVTQLAEFVRANEGELTYAQIAAAFLGGRFTSKQIQGKLLNMELYGSVRKAEKRVTPRTYTEAEEARFIQLANSGANIEAIAEALGKPVNSVRGKSLSLLKDGQIAAMPVQAVKTAKEPTDILAGHDVPNMTVAELAAATGKTERGIKSSLTRNGLSAKDYDGAAKKAKLADKA
jgi:hypothetical protein